MKSSVAVAKERRDVKRRIRQLVGDTLNEILRNDLSVDALRRLRSVIERSYYVRRSESSKEVAGHT